MKSLFILILGALLLACVKPTQIRLPAELETAKELPVKGLETSWTLDFGPFHIYNIENKNNRLLYTDFKTSFWDIESFEFFLEDEKNEQWECYCEYPTDKGLYTAFMRCEFRDKTPPEGLWILTDSILYTAGDNILILEYYGEVNQQKSFGSLPVGYIFKVDNDIRGFVYLSESLRESIWIYPFMDPHQQRALAAVSTALILRSRKLQKGLQIDFLD